MYNKSHSKNSFTKMVYTSLMTTTMLCDMKSIDHPLFFHAFFVFAALKM
jgi:hypothetical protein